ncbi:hypothetical protein E3G52_000387 [Mycobacteroides abscessus]|uniref:hypothetical protein n=1 Tax=Mycobacteroides abscessus TaxID=36809 RepID=UPI001878C5B8|nr:hypothetical protein [Mycobacteroides abscessus]MBE5453523.1 hypothetical protein [Mycobacteroides abscessus]
MEKETAEQEAARANVRRLATLRRRQKTQRDRTDTEYYEAIKTAMALDVSPTALAKDAKVSRDAIYKIDSGAISRKSTAGD